jgi:phage terminase small subunit
LSDWPAQHPQAIRVSLNLIKAARNPHNCPAMHADNELAKNMLDSVKLEHFAQAVVRLGTATAAYREAFDPEGERPHQTHWARGCQLNARPDVSKRVQELRAAALRDSQTDVASLIADLKLLVSADPNELSRSVITNCRHCHGIGHAYQWIDGNEYAAKCDEVQADNDLRREQSKTGKTRDKPLPDCDGGFGFVVRRDPAPMCPNCMGAGQLHVIIADTTKLSPAGSRLYKGIRVKGDGSVEVLMHDQVAARDQLHRLLGAYKDTLAVNQPPAPEVGKSPGDVHRSYLTMIQGGRAA